MRLAISNKVTSIAVSGDTNSSFDPDDLIPYTFDTNYVSGGAGSTLVFTLTAGTSNTYVGIAGHNLGSIGASITIRNAGIDDISNFTPVDDRPLMFNIPARSGEVEVRITKSSSAVVIISHIATGLFSDLTATSFFGQTITTTFESGAPRIAMGVNRKTRTTVNSTASPMATLTRTVGIKFPLKLSNIPEDFAAVELVVYQKFWVDNAFFIQQSDDPNQSFMAYDFISKPPRTHGQTRRLVDLTYNFTTYNGQ